MISRIKQITLIDGKQLFYPSDDEVRKLGAIKSVIIEETMSKDEFEIWREMNNGEGWITADEWLEKQKLNCWYCSKCDRHHVKDYVCGLS